MSDPGGVLAALEACVDPGALIHSAPDMSGYLSEATGHEKGAALAVARPSSTAQVAALLRAATTHNLFVTPQGGNTGLAGASIPRDSRRGLLLSLDRMKAVRALDAKTPCLTAEAGCVLAGLQNIALEAGLCLPLGLGAEGSCTLGGIISTNAGGVRALRYGNCRENVMGIEAVLPDGSIWNGLRALRKHNAGYDLKQLFIGAEGTLGVVTAAVIRLTPSWRQCETAFVALPNPEAGLELLDRLRRGCGDVVVACELIEDVGLDLALSVLPNANAPFSQKHPWLMLIEVATSGERQALRDEFEAVLGEALEAGAAADVLLASSERDRAAFWRLREGVVEGQRASGASITHDVCVPLGDVAQFIAEASSAAREMVPGARPLSFGHVGDGNIHFTVLQPPGANAEAFMALADAVRERTHGIAQTLGGSISAEHGIGRYKRDAFVASTDPLEIAAQARVKAALDPDGRMNPGVIFLD